MSKTVVTTLLILVFLVSAMMGCSRSGSVYETGLTELINQTTMRSIWKSPEEIANKSDLILVAQTDQDVTEREQYMESRNSGHLRTTVRVLEVLQANVSEPVAVGDEIQILESCGVIPLSLSNDGTVKPVLNRPLTACFPIQKGRPQLLFLYWNPASGNYGVEFEGQYDLTEVAPTPYETDALTDHSAVFNAWLDSAAFSRFDTFKWVALKLPIVAPVAGKYRK